MRKEAIILIIIVYLFTGCSLNNQIINYKANSILSNAAEASITLNEIVDSSKIIFLAEQHSIVNPILFLSNNIDSLYKKGVRYLFLEATLPDLPSSNNYNFILFYPWINSGWKYEEVELAEKIDKLNQSVSDKIKVIYAEEGNIQPDNYDPKKIPELMNGRDLYASNRIKTILNSSLINDKAIVFYGGSHGSKNIYKNWKSEKNVPKFDWKPMGSYLSEYYGASFVSIGYDYVTEYIEKNKVKLNNSVVISSQVLKDNLGILWDDSYDNVIFENEPIYGIGYQYVPTDDNLKVMFYNLYYLEKNGQEYLNESSNFRFSDLGQYLMYIYYLKLYYGDYFDYSLWNPNKELIIALEELKQYAFNSECHPSEKIVTSFNRNQVYAFYQAMRESGIEGYINFGKKTKTTLNQIIDSMKIAYDAFPNDIWSLYWLGKAYYEQKNYQNAKIVFNKILDNPLSNSIEVLPNIYKMLIECLGKGDSTKETIQNNLDNIYTEHDYSLSIFVDVL